MLQIQRSFSTNYLYIYTVFPTSLFCFVKITDYGDTHTHVKSLFIC